MSETCTPDKRPWWRFHCGRGFLRHCDVEIAFACWPRTNVQLGEIGYRITAHVAWNWPRLRTYFSAGWFYTRD